MNINDLTIGQVKEVASFAAGIGVGCKPSSTVTGDEVRIELAEVASIKCDTAEWAKVLR